MQPLEHELRPHPISALAHFIERTDKGNRSALARLSPENMRPHQMAALTRALISADLSPTTWQSDTWQRWALVAHGMALAGHDGKSGLGVQLHQAEVSESRVTKLLVSRGDALLQIVPRLLRLMASKQVSPNWHDLSQLILHDDSTNPQELERVENRRLRIAGDYFSAQARKAQA